MLNSKQGSHAPPLIVVQARLGSTRLPGKVLLDVLGEPLLVRMIERVMRIDTEAQVVVATTAGSEDDRIVDVCRAWGVEVFRGHATDCLDRHYKVALEYQADVVAKVPSDCPLIDPPVIDQMFLRFSEGKYDYASNLHPASYPDGNDVEVMTKEVLATAWREASQPFEREHTTPFIWERPGRFRLSNVRWQSVDGEPGLDYSMTHRWTIDYPEDYEFVRAVYEQLYPADSAFGLDDILDLLERKPEIARINERYKGVNWYRHHMDQLKTISADQTRNI